MRTYSGYSKHWGRPIPGTRIAQNRSRTRLSGDCTHHWILESPSVDIETTQGVCRLCGAERDFLARGRGGTG